MSQFCQLVRIFLPSREDSVENKESIFSDPDFLFNNIKEEIDL